MSDLPGLGSCIPNPSREWGLKTPARMGRGGIAGKCCKQKVTVHFQGFLSGTGGLGEQPGSAGSYTHGGVLGPQQRNPTLVQLQKHYLGCFPQKRFTLLVKTSLPEERQAVCLTI